MAVLDHEERRLHAMYRRMTTEALRSLQAAFELDLQTATRPESIAFGAGRLALITDVLKTREATNGQRHEDGTHEG